VLPVVGDHDRGLREVRLLAAHVAGHADDLVGGRVERGERLVVSMVDLGQVGEVAVA
jgi:hypothetical protein